MLLGNATMKSDDIETVLTRRCDMPLEAAAEKNDAGSDLLDILVQWLVYLPDTFDHSTSFSSDWDPMLQCYYERDDIETVLTKRCGKLQ